MKALHELHFMMEKAILVRIQSVNAKFISFVCKYQ